MPSTMVTSGTMRHRIDPLEKAGLVARVRNPDDGRGFMVSLSPRGLEVIDAAATAHAETQVELVEGLTDEQRAHLDDLLRQWLRTFERG